MGSGSVCRVWILKCPSSLLCAHEVEIPAEGFPAFATLVGLVSHRNNPVDGEQNIPNEGLAHFSKVGPVR